MDDQKAVCTEIRLGLERMVIRLVADVGGTNSRLALSQEGVICEGTIQSFANADWDSLYAVIDAYLAQDNGESPKEMVIAFAGPVRGDQALLTNRNWTIDAGKLRRDFASDNVHILNDLTALGYAVPVLGPDQLRCVSSGVGKQAVSAQSLVVGIGTGFNVSPVLENAGTVICLSVEAGHMSMPLSVVEKLRDFGFQTTQFPTTETLFSGRGFEAFCQKQSGQGTLTGPAAIAAYGATNAEEITDAVDQYSTVLGHLLRDLSLAYMPTSGIYLAGSVARSVVNVSPRHCIEVFQQPCNIRANAIPTVWSITNDAAALLGCAGYSF